MPAKKDSARNIPTDEGELSRNQRLKREASAAPAKPVAVEVLVELPTDSIRPSILNPRKHFDEASLAELAESIKQHGVQQPIRVRGLVETGGAQYDIIMGERRWRAAKLAGLSHIPAIVSHNMDDREHLELALIENLHRRDLDVIEEAEGYAALASLGYKQKEIAAVAGRAQPSVASSMHLLKLPADVIELVRSGKLSAAHGKVLSKISAFPALASKVASYVMKQGMTSKRFEKIGVIVNTYELEKSKLILRIDGHENRALFDHKKICGKCPFDAVRKDYGSSYCLKPEHYEELQNEARAKLVELEAVGDENDPSGRPMKPKAVNVSKMSWETYVDLTGEKVEGCSAKCLCRAKGQRDGQKSTFPICLKPKEHQKLKTKATRLARKHIKERAAVIFNRFAEETAAIEGIDTRAITMLVFRVMDGYNMNKDTIELVTAATGLPVPPGGWKNYNERATFLDHLATVPPAELLRFLVLCLARQEMKNRIEGGYTTLEFRDSMQWYFGDPEPKPAAPTVEHLESADEPEEIEEPEETTEGTCRVCGCTDSDCRQCVEKTGEPCHWIEPDLCSACVPELVEA